MNLLVLGYVLYLAASLFVTTYVGHVLHRESCPLCRDVFRESRRTADAVNDLLLVGYYLVNFALDVLLLRPGDSVIEPLDVAEWVSGRLGIVLTTLGGLHFINVSTLLVGMRWLRRRRLRMSGTSGGSSSPAAL